MHRRTPGTAALPGLIASMFISSLPRVPRGKHSFYPTPNWWAFKWGWEEAFGWKEKKKMLRVLQNLICKEHRARK